MRRDFFLLLAILALGIFLRVYNIDQTLLFHFDQAYHGLAIKEIWETKKIALLGHKTDVEGIFHGSTFYYLMLPFYLVSSWNPARVSTLLALLDGLCLIFIFLIGRELFDKKVGFLAAFFYGISYSVISFSRWLSNVTLIPFFSVIFFYFLLKAYKEDFRFLVAACFAAGLVIQLNGAIGFFFLPLLVLFFFLLRKKLFSSKKHLILSSFFFLLPTLPLIFFEARHNFLVSSSIVRLLFKEGNLGFYPGRIFSNLTLLRTEFINLLSYKMPLLAFFFFGLTIAASWRVFAKRQKETGSVRLLCAFLLIPFLGLLFYQGGIHGFFIVGILPGLVIFLSWGSFYWANQKILRLPIVLLVSSLTLLNLYHWRGFLAPNLNLVPIGTRNLITLEDRKKAVDFIYKQADGESFKRLIYIIPYFQEQPWDYVFSWYGAKRYGYLPNGKGDKTFIIYEPDYDFPYRLEAWLGKIEEDHGRTVSIFKSHDLTVEERQK